MARDSYNDLLAFIQVAQQGSFTKAAAQMGVSPSALSHAIRALEARLDMRLLTRTTRSVSTTDAGLRLLASVAPHFADIDAELSAVSALRNKPSGTVRITASEFAASYLIWPKLSQVLTDYPDITVEVTVDYNRTDIVAERYDAGVRLGDEVAKDMIAVRISADQRIAVVGSPAYFAERSLPKKPQDLAEHNCINLRLPTHGGLLPWDFQKGRKVIKVRVTGQWIYNSSTPMLRAALAGQGLAFLPEDMALDHLAKGELVRVLDDWCQPYSGYHLYYPSRRQTSGALAVVVDALRHTEPARRARKPKAGAAGAR
ncbi:LysR family transcriptional regulator [Acidovorax sp. CCYZU-2555]|uniref:LysR family transcriptional regulator n=1 Tax=Acidovorax sp. CCYZU-2555 TaxID=2835042 RepID=UPI001BCF002A|nr:LysR family transcriptional regulator [Acidovorax sp. CCYZU-2555]MBS7781423.1 LysR family transcriptional regulator [Acidovorax sp. CCYZU-2555]